MPPRALAILFAAFALCFLAVGWPYWNVPYAQVSLPGTLVGGQLLIVALIAAVAVALRVGPLPVLAVVGAATPMAVLVRVLRDASLDPTSHNLWPFELVLAGGLGFAVALAGVLLGLLAAKALGLRREEA